MQTLVTGATGHLGAVLVELLPGARGASRASGVDVRDEAAVRAVMAGCEAVVHTAFVQDGPDAWSTNVDGAAVVARAAAVAGARLVHLSSDVVFDGRLGRPYTEDDRPTPPNDYGRSKAAAEEKVLAAHPAATVVRTSLILGRDSRHEQVDPAGTFFDDEWRSPVHVDDLAAAIVALLGRAHAGPLHLGGADDLTRHALAELVAGRPLHGAPGPPERPKDCRLASRHAAPLPGIRERLAKTKSSPSSP